MLCGRGGDGAQVSLINLLTKNGTTGAQVSLINLLTKNGTTARPVRDKRTINKIDT